MFYILHALIGILLPLLVFSLIGCTKIKEDPGKLGPDIGVAEIDRALNKAIGNPTYKNLRLGQFADYSLTRRLEAEESTITLGGLRVDVSDYTETETEERFTLYIVKSTRLENGEFEVRESEQELVFAKSSVNAQSGFLKYLQFQAAVQAATSGEIEPKEGKLERTTFHRLIESSGEIDPPARVRDRPDCGGVINCKLPVNYLQFDMVNWYSDGSKQKVAFDFAFSSATPVLAFGQDLFEQLTGVTVMDCRSTYVPIQKRTVYVRDCQALEDFQN